MCGVFDFYCLVIIPQVMGKRKYMFTQRGKERDSLLENPTTKPYPTKIKKHAHGASNTTRFFLKKIPHVCSKPVFSNATKKMSTKHYTDVRFVVGLK